MKTDINTILNSLVSYAIDNLMLDPLDAGYALNRLASVAGVPCPPMKDTDEAELADLMSALGAAAPNADKAAIMDVLFPMPRTVNMYFQSKLERDSKKAFDMLFDLYAHANLISDTAGCTANGCYMYSPINATPVKSAALNVNGETLFYTPKCVFNRIATLDNPDILVDDLINREIAFAVNFGQTVAAKVGGGEYLCCDKSALSQAETKTNLASGTVKIDLLSYPVPALAFYGVAKNAVSREVAKTVIAATEAGVQCVVAADNADGLKVYTVFAKDLASAEFVVKPDALSACGVQAVKDCTPMLSVLEKGTALSTDIAEFKPIYDKIGGVKHGKNALAALGGALYNLYLPLLTAAASATEEQAVGFVSGR